MLIHQKKIDTTLQSKINREYNCYHPYPTQQKNLPNKEATEKVSII